MFSRIAAFAVAYIGLVIAAPQPVNRAAIDDTIVLQFALTLEHLENAFYSGALARFSTLDFERAGFTPDIRGRFEQIAAHEVSHVALLTSALGNLAPAACNYSFPYNDPRSFAALSQILEGVGTSAYLGAAQYITTPAYLTVAGSILAVEARHDAYVAAVANQGPAWNTAYDTPLGLSGVYSLASIFITSCPSTNPALPVTTYPALVLNPPAPIPGHSVKVSLYQSSVVPAYLAFFNGLSVLYAPISNGKAVVPASLANSGVVYVAGVSSNGTVTDQTMVSGLAILEELFGPYVVQ